MQSKSKWSIWCREFKHHQYECNLKIVRTEHRENQHTPVIGIANAMDVYVQCVRWYGEPNSDAKI